MFFNSDLLRTVNQIKTQRIEERKRTIRLGDQNRWCTESVKILRRCMSDQMSASEIRAVLLACGFDKAKSTISLRSYHERKKDGNLGYPDFSEADDKIIIDNISQSASAIGDILAKSGVRRPVMLVSKRKKELKEWM